eukprot:CAMPEP_0170166726 /NCGR_PEP_ID=MMETSP0040_2-20121228/331_1 /TAXON_ID=641309 /ORGANISM="Lotharella oceanica, Strain CCMP622" /LENGTH=211 /DNA_ID=CAMNT_0010404529 /DNA_START=259 /DNA_END=895 /DNA_ORIENTATION=+
MGSAQDTGAKAYLEVSEHLLRGHFGNVIRRRVATVYETAAETEVYRCEDKSSNGREGPKGRREAQAQLRQLCAALQDTPVALHRRAPGALPPIGIREVKVKPFFASEKNPFSCFFIAARSPGDTRSNGGGAGAFLSCANGGGLGAAFRGGGEGGAGVLRTASRIMSAASRSSDLSADLPCLLATSLANDDSNSSPSARMHILRPLLRLPRE